MKVRQHHVFFLSQESTIREPRTVVRTYWIYFSRSLPSSIASTSVNHTPVMMIEIKFGTIDHLPYRVIRIISISNPDNHGSPIKNVQTFSSKHAVNVREWSWITIRAPLWITKSISFFPHIGDKRNKFFVFIWISWCCNITTIFTTLANLK